MAVKYTEEQLNTVDKSLLIRMFLAEQEHTEELTRQVQELNEKLTAMDEKMQKLIEQVIISNKTRFGRSTEKMNDPAQIRFAEVNGTIVFFNDAEAEYKPDAPEPEIPMPRKRGVKVKGKKEQDFRGLPVERIDHYLSQEELVAEFGENGWKQLPDAVTTCYLMYDYLHEHLYNYHVIQADEPPCLVNRDGRPAGSKRFL